MAAPSLQTLQRTAGQTGYQPGTLEKVLRLLDLLQEISDDAFLGARLALKGGTALNVFHLGLDRLSVDIDLNYIGALDREEMAKERPEVENALHRILASQGYQIRRQPADHAGGKWVARHASALGGSATLEVDVNYMMREPLFGALRMDSAVLGETRSRAALVLDIHEIVAGKFVALLDRRAARDLFDARRILDIQGLNWNWIRTAMLAIGACGRRDWRTVSINDIGADPNELRRKLAICLPHAAFASKGAVDEWIEESVALCRQQIAPLLDLTPHERAFLDGVVDRGEIFADLISADTEIQARISRMPMLAWKRQNVRRHLGLDDALGSS